MIKKICFHRYATRTNQHFGKDQHDLYHIVIQFYFALITYYFFKTYKKRIIKNRQQSHFKAFYKTLTTVSICGAYFFIVVSTPALNVI